MTTHAEEMRRGDRFGFGDNWNRFLELLDDSRIAEAEASLRKMLGRERLDGRSFLDIGSGSGLFSLAARRLGARVMSFDFDPQSVACTQALRDRFHPGDEDWSILRGSVLDDEFVGTLPVSDIVYSWGVLHHTGRMWHALEMAAGRVAPGGQLFIAIYNDQGAASRRWLRVKQAYNRLPAPLRFLVLWPAFLRLWGPVSLLDLLRGHPFRTWRTYLSNRGMSPWRDVVDWVGGLPFEVARPEAILEFHRSRGFEAQRVVTCGGGYGCNEFVFSRRSDGP